MSASLLEETIAFGCRTFIVCGGCGVLEKDIAVGGLIVISAAVRDEGVSYHYLPPSREVLAQEAGVNVLVRTLDNRGIPHRVGKTWTTDAPYRETADKIARRREEGCIAVEMEAAGMMAVAQFRNAETNWGLQGPLFYEFGRLLGDPERDYEALIEEYCRGVYGRAADTMLAFFDLLYRRHERYALNPGHYGKIPPRGEDGKWLSMSEIYLDLYIPQLLQELEALLSKAEREAETDRSRGWLRLTRDHFDFAKLLTETIRSYRTWQADRSTKNWIDLKARVETFDAYRTRIITYPKEYTDLWFPGHDKFCNYLTSDAQSEHDVYYSNWENRKEAVLRQGVKGTGIGYVAGGSIRYVREPLTLDFSKQQQFTR